MTRPALVVVLEMSGVKVEAVGEVRTKEVPALLVCSLLMGFDFGFVLTRFLDVSLAKVYLISSTICHTLSKPHEMELECFTHLGKCFSR